MKTSSERFFALLLSLTIVFNCFCLVSSWTIRRNRRSSEESDEEEAGDETIIFFSPVLSWSPSNSHVLTEYDVIKEPESVFVFYYLQCAKEVPKFEKIGNTQILSGYEWVYTNTSVSGELNFDLTSAGGRPVVCGRMFDPSAAAVCPSFRVVFGIEIISGDVDFDLPDFSRSCYQNEETTYTADCSFDNDESCEYRNDACGFVLWKVDNGLILHNDIPLLKEKTTSACETLLDIVAMQVSGFTKLQTSGTSKKGRKKRSDDRKRAGRAASDRALFLNPKNVERGLVATGAFNTPTLAYHVTRNKAVSFSYYFYARGAHQIVVSMLCVSRGWRQLRLRRYKNYDVRNFKVQLVDQSGTKCLNLHAYLGDCKKFQVQFVGGARGSKLAIDNVKFKSSCGKYDNI